MSRSFTLAFLMAAFGGLGFPGSAQAKIFQVTQPADLQPALSEAQANGQADTIEIGPGNWSLSEANGGQTFRYTAADTENFPLEIVGAGFDQTILDGEGAEAILSIRTATLLASEDAQAAITVRRLGFRNGHTIADAGGGLSILTQDASVRVEGCSFSGNTTTPPGLAAGGGAGGGLSVRSTGAGDVALVNNVFHGNRAAQLDDQLGLGGGAFLSLGAGAATLVHNTFFDNAADRQGGGLALSLDTEATAVLFNNIVFGNTAALGGDIVASAKVGSLQAFNNDFGSFCHDADCDFAAFLGAGQGGNLMIDPLFVAAGDGDLRLTAESPVIDRGSANAPELPGEDIAGNPRTDGAAPDMGAFEFSEDDGNGGAADQGGGCSLNGLGTGGFGPHGTWLAAGGLALAAALRRRMRS